MILQLGAELGFVQKSADLLEEGPAWVGGGKPGLGFKNLKILLLNYFLDFQGWNLAEEGLRCQKN